MTGDFVLQLLGTVAFPICMCLIMAWYVKYQLDQHRSEMSEFSKAIDANTQVITKLYERLEAKFDDN